mmetsp:Transcript_16097/g.24975  ORF Transcript_16097/g.24975 Transcript_16097/m.24975 type:complete len:163 (+) Transcript_16097:183-671(+)
MSRKLAGWVALSQAFVTPALFMASFSFSQTEGLSSYFGSVDKSQDLSGVRFHGSFSEALELRVHTSSILSAPLILIVMSSAFSLLRNGSFLTTFFRAIGGSISGTFLFHLIFVLFGAPLIDAWAKTLAFSLYLSTLAAVPMSCIMGGDVNPHLSTQTLQALH